MPSVPTWLKCYMNFYKYLQDMFTVSVASKRDGSKPLNVFCFALVAGGDWEVLWLSELIPNWILKKRLTGLPVAKAVHEPFYCLVLNSYSKQNTENTSRIWMNSSLWYIMYLWCFVFRIKFRFRCTFLVTVDSVFWTS